MTVRASSNPRKRNNRAIIRVHGRTFYQRYHLFEILSIIWLLGCRIYPEAFEMGTVISTETLLTGIMSDSLANDLGGMNLLVKSF